MPYTNAQIDSICKHSNKVALLSFLKKLNFDVNNEAENWHAIKYNDLGVLVSERIMVDFISDKNGNILKCELSRESTGP